LGSQGDGPDGLDLVAPPLEAHGRAAGAREDVHNPTAHRELPVTRYPVDPLVAQRDQPREAIVQLDLTAALEMQGLIERRLLPHRQGSRDHDPRPREGVQSTLTLSDTHRRRAEDIAIGDAARREVNHGLVREASGILRVSLGRLLAPGE
jgi:hypothetical protein